MPLLRTEVNGFCNQVVQRISQLQDMLAPNVTAAMAADAMLKCADDIDAAAVMLMSVSDRGPPPPVPPKPAGLGGRAAPPAAAPLPKVEEQPACVICMNSPPTHAFIPCGHKHLCGACATDDSTLQALHQKCPVCRREFQCIVQIFEG